MFIGFFRGSLFLKAILRLNCSFISNILSHGCPEGLDTCDRNVEDGIALVSLEDGIAREDALLAAPVHSLVSSSADDALLAVKALALVTQLLLMVGETSVDLKPRDNNLLMANNFDNGRQKNLKFSP